MPFERTEEYLTNITLDALDRNVVLDADVNIIQVGSKLKAYCPQTSTYLQFPRAIRKRGATFVADVVKSAKQDGQIFYRAYKNSIRKTKTGNPIA